MYSQVQIYILLHLKYSSGVQRELEWRQFFKSDLNFLYSELYSLCRLAVYCNLEAHMISTSLMKCQIRYCLMRIRTFVSYFCLGYITECNLYWYVLMVMKHNHEQIHSNCKVENIQFSEQITTWILIRRTCNYSYYFFFFST